MRPLYHVAWTAVLLGFFIVSGDATAGATCYCADGSVKYRPFVLPGLSLQCPAFVCGQASLPRSNTLIYAPIQPSKFNQGYNSQSAIEERRIARSAKRAEKRAALATGSYDPRRLFVLHNCDA